jgi:hypothetical protein
MAMVPSRAADAELHWPAGQTAFAARFRRLCARRCRRDAGTHPPPPRLEPPMIPERGMHRVKEVAMTRRVRLWITAMLSIAATALVVGLTITAQAGVNQTHTHPPLAGAGYGTQSILYQILPYIEQDLP